MSSPGHSTRRYFLGLDLSTQQLKAVILNEYLVPVVHRAVHFDRDLPHYGTTGGCHTQYKRVTAPSLMWVEAVDVLFDQLARDPSVPLDRIVAIGGAAQQHSSVYWSDQGCNTLSNLDPHRPLKEQLQHGFVVHHTPTWQDASTTRECQEFEELLGGPAKVAKLTGARAYERYTAHQITKLYKLQPEVYRRCRRISLASSFLGSLFLGKIMPVDTADGSGMNLMDLGSRIWSQDALIGAVSDSSLGTKLGGPQGLVPTQQVMGNISAYWSDRYGLPRDCQILAFTGDNPSTLAGLPMQDRDLAVSLGTSDTAFLATRQPHANLTDLVMCHPIDPQHWFMRMVCFKNGSLTRVWVRDTYAQGTWSTFNDYLQTTPPGCQGHVGFYFNVPEILPHAHGIRRFAVDLTSPVTNTSLTTSPSAPSDSIPSHCQPLSNFPDPRWNVRAIVESQALNMKIHTQNRGLTALDRILAVGGAAENRSLLQVWADVFGVPIYQVGHGIAASDGSALRAAFTVLCPDAANSDTPLPYYVRFLEQSSLSMQMVASPNPTAHAVYRRMEPIFKSLLHYMERQCGY